MDPRADPRRLSGGFVTPQLLVVAGFTLLLMVLVAQVTVVAYARGVVRAAVDEGARQGAARSSDPVGACQARAAELLHDLLGGSLGANVAPVSCAADAGTVTAATSGDVASWLPGLPPWSLDAQAAAVRRPDPAAG